MIIVEQPLTMKRVHSSACWGTPDVRGWKQRATGQWALYVWDLKFGFKRVEVFENKQLVLYVIGALEEAKINGSADQSTPVVMKVFQPRAYHPDGPMRQWACLASDLRALTNRLMMAAEEATGVAPSCKPNADACENCLARSGCDALQEAAYRGMEITRQTIPRELSPEAAGLELAYLTDAAKLMEARISGLEELVKHQLAQGARVPYWRMGSGRASTEWTKTPQEIATLGRLLGLDLAKPLDVITPLQAKAKGLPESLLPQYSESRPGATKLIREDNASVRRIFTSSAV